ncbi:MAG: tetratricopeptide repeat protein [Lactobacillus sp.]|nr:tetratricopeptide repeat protein [Lactobacillus sp.]
MKKENEQVQQRVKELIKKIDQAPKQTDNYLELATVLIEQGEIDQAFELLKKATQVVANPEELYYDLAVCHYLEGEFEEALGLLNKLPNDDLTLYQKALTFLKLGLGAKALAYALSIKQVDDKVNELLADCWIAVGDLKSAKSCLLKIKQATSKVNFLLGIVTLPEDQAEGQKYFAKSKAQDKKYYESASSQYGSLMQLLSKQEGVDD